MSALAEAQTAFIAQLLDDDLPLPTGWNERSRVGLEIYRNNYRTALVEALRDTYARTARWVGDAAFEQAAAHHLVLHPPSSWTLDRAGAGFECTVSELFANDHEVGELAWTEWAMLEAFGARDAVPLSATAFAAETAALDEAGWDALRLQFMPGLATRIIAYDLGAIWRLLDQTPADADLNPAAPLLAVPLACHVYREGELPVFVTAPAHERGALDAMRAGASFGATCALLAAELGLEAAAPEAGAMLGRWLHQGLIEGIAPFSLAQA